MKTRAPLWIVMLALAGGCNSDELPEAAEQTSEVPPELRVDRPVRSVPVNGVTPMEEREATLGLLNKRNGLTRDLKLNPGEAARVGNVVVRLRACEQAAPWEQLPETGAFVQLVVQGRDDQWRRVFSGWLFKERPERNVIQHPIYDVYVKSCAMTFPGTPAEDDDASSAPNEADAAPSPPVPSNDA